MKKKKNELNELVTAANEKFHALVGELLDADVPPEVISTAMAQELTCSIAAIAAMKKGKSPEERLAFVTRFFEMLANLTLGNVKNLEVLEEAGHEYN
ncbi:MAG: hypothetical protein IKQ62_01970 [Bacteroidaceae bacterium]|nr:hypothetical protein [Bacteroidaceae bacterium]